jgi:hypothetical protein
MPNAIVRSRGETRFHLDPANNKPVGSDRADPVLNLKFSFDTAFDLIFSQSFQSSRSGKNYNPFFPGLMVQYRAALLGSAVRQRPIRFRGKVQMWYYVPVR